MGLFNELFGGDPKLVWVKRNIYSYSVSDSGRYRIHHGEGSFAITSAGKTTSYYNGSMGSNLDCP